ncbi:Gfo/Idh/MocA family protein [Planctomicrobium sp. SH668]|uniref:Gfo/Idh/MocA family protein n=1 Tax=Planctomicrobium sp. SH668 TaxID=3448126 RepID=UPI003F5B41C2
MKTQKRKVRVALLGCGQIADAHLSQLRRVKNAEIVAVCDMHEDLAYQAAARFQVPQTFINIEQMLEQVHPDVVHITTPAHTHARLSKQLLEAGCHIYVEKPFTLDTPDARDVLATAERCGKSVCVGHDQLFDPAWLKCREWIQKGVIGDVAHIESILGYPIDGKFGSLVAASPNHWVRKLPGGLFQNTISHPLYRILDLMEDDQPAILGGAWTRPEYDFPTELSVSFQGNKQSGSLTFSTFLPPQRITRIYGKKGTIQIDFDAQTLQLNRLMKLPGAFAKLEAPIQQFRNSCWNLTRNFWNFAKSEIHYFAGMKNLFEAFYASILNGTPAPISPHEVERVTLMMDRIFDLSRNHSSENGHSSAEVSAPQSPVEESKAHACP